MSSDVDSPPPKLWQAVLMLWLAGNALRITILAIPPVLATIRDDFALSATQVGLLSSIPPALFAIASLVGSLLVMKLGLKRALVGGLLIVAIGSAMRGLSPNYSVLFVTTVVMSIGVAIMQPIMPTGVRQWMPQRVGTGTAIYTNGLLVGETLPVMCAASLVLPLVHGSWRMSLVVWSVPIALIALFVWWAAPHDHHDATVSIGAPRKWLPDWHKGLVWRLGLLFACFNTIYFSTNAFMPIYLASVGRSDLIGSALTALNLGQLPASLLLLFVAQRLERKAWAYVWSGLLSLAGVVGIALDVGPVATVWWAGLLGFANAAALIVGLTLPPLLCERDDVPRTAAGMFTISYATAVVLSTLSGAMWDLSGIPMLAFAPIAAISMGLVVIAMYMRAKGELV